MYIPKKIIVISFFMTLCIAFCAKSFARKENFIVKKTKQVVAKVVVPYHEQWGNQFANFLIQSTHLQESLAQLHRKGADAIVSCIEGKEMPVEKLSDSEQKEWVNELENLVKKAKEFTQACDQYTKKISLKEKTKKK